MPFWIKLAVRYCRRCGVAGCERVPPAPLGWYLIHEYVSMGIKRSVRTTLRHAPYISKTSQTLSGVGEYFEPQKSIWSTNNNDPPTLTDICVAPHTPDQSSKHSQPLPGSCYNPLYHCRQTLLQSGIAG